MVRVFYSSKYVGSGFGFDTIRKAKWIADSLEWCSARRLPIAYVLAGGYIGDRLDESGLVALHRLTLSAASRE